MPEGTRNQRINRIILLRKRAERVPLVGLKYFCSIHREKLLNCVTNFKLEITDLELDALEIIIDRAEQVAQENQ